MSHVEAQADNARFLNWLSCDRDDAIKEAGKKETEALGTQISIPDALRFKGIGPEFINSRLAMVSITLPCRPLDASIPGHCDNISEVNCCCADRCHHWLPDQADHWREHLRPGKHYPVWTNTSALTALTQWTKPDSCFGGLQYAAAPLPVILTFIVFIAASLIPITKGVTPEKAANGIWTTKAEIYNGRLAVSPLCLHSASLSVIQMINRI